METRTGEEENRPRGEVLSTRVPGKKVARRVQSKLMAENLPNAVKDTNLLILRQ